MVLRLVLVCLLMAGVIAQETHWAFVPPRRAPVPAVQAASWVVNDIDRFVLARGEAAGLAPSPRASRAELLRRVTFDVTGLPPTLAELEAFEVDARDDAYEHVVQRLLATPAAAEESTRLWLDLSRYADTHGMQTDQVRALWRWRDWVLDACLDNVPFDRFVTEQLAGDLLPNATAAQRIASGWNRNNPTSDEGGLIPAEYLSMYAKNRVDTFGTTMLGLTVGCAQCHDHKSDPLTQRDYYRLSAYFASFAENGNDGGGLAPEPSMLAGTEAQMAELERLRAAAHELRTQLDAAPWQLVELHGEQATSFTRQPDGSLLATGDAPERGDYQLSATGELGLATTLRLTVLPDDSLPQRGPGRAHNGNFVLSEIEVEAGDGTTSHRCEIRSTAADFEQPGFLAAHVLDGDEATGWALQGRHQATALYVELTKALPPGTAVVRVRLRHQSKHAQHLIGRLSLHTTTTRLGDLPLRARAAGRQHEEFEAQVPVCMISGELAAPRSVHVLLRGRYDQPGEEVAPGTPSFLPPLPCDGPGDDSIAARSDRRALAKWLFAADHPLTARVAVNRFWRRHFGRGLVPTLHDFGVHGARPTHPELLDWLACEFVASGWDERHLHTLMLTSATYRQSARATVRQRERDPDNVWLMRTSRERLPAEAIRDQALAVGGLLVDRRGGPSVRIQQPPGIWEAVAFPGSNTEHYEPDTDDALRRRSLYTFWKRTAPPPLLTILDAPSREQCVVERQVTNTPLQILALWNDEGLVAAARAFGQRCIEAADDTPARLRFAFRTLLQRGPNDAERAACEQLLAESADEVHGWTVLANLLLTLDESLHRN